MSTGEIENQPTADIEIKDLCGEKEEEQEPRLTEMVRQHYLNYLEKQLLENSQNYHCNEKDIRLESDEHLNISIKRTAKDLEQKAVESCMIAQYYQRAMVKIIAIVRRSTQDNRLINQLEKSILNTCNKETQTEEAGLLSTDNNTSKPPDNHYEQQIAESHEPIDENHEMILDENHEMTLDEKIEIFQKHLIKEHNTKYKSTTHDKRKDYKSSENRRRSKLSKTSHSQRKQYEKHHQHHHHRPYKESRAQAVDDSPTNSVITTIRQPLTLGIQEEILNNSINEVVADMDNSNDSVGLELARLFSEEKTELDEIFGINPNQEPDDPQICKILKEIEQAKVNENPPRKQEISILSLQPTHDQTEKAPKVPVNLSTVTEKTRLVATTKPVDLSKSLWPCELFMQKRKLSESLARLIEEDLRWHDVIKWKFYELFGEDSDDEFTPCSPSIDLDEILMGSCVKRISPWVVKHLMKPMRDGLIGNRFIFKKLAKHIARSIITENQYPDESIIKGCIENYFCLHQAVMTSDDLQDVPSIST